VIREAVSEYRELSRKSFLKHSKGHKKQVFSFEKHLFALDWTQKTGKGGDFYAP